MGVLKREIVLEGFESAGQVADSQSRGLGIEPDLDAALEEVVAQMRGGFASKADLQEVEEHLRRLASIQRGTANEIASNKAGLSDYELQLKRVADQVRASQAKTPRFQRLEQCVASVLCHPLATS